jgi:hypothetical protein
MLGYRDLAGCASTDRKIHASEMRGSNSLSRVSLMTANMNLNGGIGGQVELRYHSPMKAELRSARSTCSCILSSSAFESSVPKSHVVNATAMASLARCGYYIIARFEPTDLGVQGPRPFLRKRRLLYLTTRCRTAAHQ